VAVHPAFPAPSVLGGDAQLGRVWRCESAGACRWLFDNRIGNYACRARRRQSSQAVRKPPHSAPTFERSAGRPSGHCYSLRRRPSFSYCETKTYGELHSSEVDHDNFVAFICPMRGDDIGASGGLPGSMPSQLRSVHEGLQWCCAVQQPMQGELQRLPPLTFGQSEIDARALRYPSIAESAAQYRRIAATPNSAIDALVGRVVRKWAAPTRQGRTSSPQPWRNPRRNAPQWRPRMKIGEDASFIRTKLPPPMSRR
jgi:hypothetical protein